MEALAAIVRTKVRNRQSTSSQRTGFDHQCTTSWLDAELSALEQSAASGLCYPCGTQPLQCSGIATEFYFMEVPFCSRSSRQWRLLRTVRVFGCAFPRTRSKIARARSR